MKKINKNDIVDIIALSPLQEGMLFNYLKEIDSLQYFEQLSIGLTGKIDFDQFTNAWNYVIEKNEMLRTVFRWDKLNRPVQIILKERSAPIDLYNFEEYPENRKCELIREMKLQDRKRRIELDDLPFRITLIQLAVDRYFMIISNHHILWDGWSTGIILKEFQNAYIEMSCNRIPVTDMKCTYKDFIKYLRRQDISRCDDYWKKYLDNFVLYDNEYINVMKKEKQKFKKLCKGYSSQLYKDLVETAQQYRVTFAAVFYAAWSFVLKKYYDRDDIVFGVTVSGRECPIDHVESLVGLLINTLPLRVQMNQEETISDLISNIGTMLVNHQEFSATALKEIMRCNDMSGKELFNSIVTIENYPIDELLSKKNDYIGFDSIDMFESTEFDLTLTVYLEPEFRVEFAYNEHMFDQNTLDYLVDYLDQMLSELAKKENQKIRTLCSSKQSVINQLQDDFNDDLEDE